MLSYFQRLQNRPLLILGVLWPLVLLAAQLPGIPRASVPGLPWRQELALTLLLSLTVVALLLKRRSTLRLASLGQTRLAPFAFATVFVIWIFLSAGWATDRYQAMHLGLQWSSYLVFFALMTSAASDKVIRSSFITLGVVIWILAIACAIETWFGAPLTDFNLRNGVKPLLRGFSGLGEVTGAACILFAAFALHLNRPRAALVCGATAVAGWLATLQSLERAPLIGATVGLAVLFVGALVRPSRRRVRRLGLMFASLALVLWFQTGAVKTSSEAASAGDVSTITRLRQDLASDPNTRARFLFWGVGLEMLRSHPMLGVGANNYQVEYGNSRAQFSARYPSNPLVSMNEDLLAGYAHNEYVQMAAELGLVGFVLFVLFGVSLLSNFVRAIRIRRPSLPVFGAGGAMLAFAISSGASAASFRHLGGGLVFFFAAALISRRVNSAPSLENEASKAVQLPHRTLKFVSLGFCALMPLCVALFAAQAIGSTLQALGETTADSTQAERYFQASLRIYPANAAAHFGYGMWLSGKGRWADSLPHLRYAVARGFNSSVCYEFLATAQDSAGDSNAAEQTLASAVRVYPQSVFLLVRHSVTLERLGRNADGQKEFSKALLINPRASRGWQQLIVNDIDAAGVAARHDANIAQPGELTPQAAVYSVLRENEIRFPEASRSGWRALMLSKQSQ